MLLLIWIDIFLPLCSRKHEIIAKVTHWREPSLRELTVYSPEIELVIGMLSFMFLDLFYACLYYNYVIINLRLHDKFSIALLKSSCVAANVYICFLIFHRNVFQRETKWIIQPMNVKNHLRRKRKHEENRLCSLR